MYDNIPHEMRQYNQWVVWKLVEREGGKPTKVPIDPKTGKNADVNDPSTWSSYDTAVAVSPRVSGIGFVLTNNDPYAFIDLDDTHGDVEAMERQIKVYSYFNSYSELSPSGNGLHIIAKGSLPVGRRRNSIEIYSNQRFMTMTGNVYNNVGIQERQGLFELLFNEMGGPVQNYWVGEDKEETKTDEEIVKQASEALNGPKFSALQKGEWIGAYPSQSEADFAFVDIIAFYTQNKQQIARIFRASALGQTPKDGYAHRGDRFKYVEYMVNKSFDRQLPPLDLDGIKIKGEQVRFGKQRVEIIEAPKFKSEKHTINFPPGLVGEIAEFFLAASPRQVPTVALASSIATLAGITGRAYNVNGAGLNQYIAIIANTGTGKDIISEGMSKLFDSIRPSLPNSATFKGPGTIASQQGLVRWLEKHPSIVTTIGELGLELARMSSPRASPNDRQIQTLLLKLYSKSGFGNVFDPSAYADMGKNTAPILSPSFTLVGESTPQEFYGNLDENMISRGLLPRFLTFEYKGMNPYLADNHTNARPSIQLVERFGALAAECLRCQGFNQIRNVAIAPDADVLLRAYDRKATDLINESASEVTKQLWNRAQLKAMKLAALIAVGINYLNPVLTADLAQYAIDLVSADVDNIIGRFAKGDMGLMISHDVEEYGQIQEMGKVIHDWFFNIKPNYEKYHTPKQMIDDGVFLYSSVQLRLFPNPKFKKDKFGATNAIKKCFQYFVDADDIQEVPRSQMAAKYGKVAKAYAIKNMARFKEFE